MQVHALEVVVAAECLGVLVLVIGEQQEGRLAAIQRGAAVPRRPDKQVDDLKRTAKLFAEVYFSNLNLHGELQWRLADSHKPMMPRAPR